MGVAKVDEGVQLLSRKPEVASLVGPRDAALVDAAEAALGVRFPPSYRRFVLAFGAGYVGSEEFYGVITSDFTNSSVPNGIWVTFGERRYGLSDKVIVVGPAGWAGGMCSTVARRRPTGSFRWPSGPRGRTPRTTTSWRCWRRTSARSSWREGARRRRAVMAG